MHTPLARCLIGASFIVIFAGLATAEDLVAIPKFSTPDECFQAVIKSKDLSKSMACYSEAMRNYFLGKMAFDLEEMSVIKDYGDDAKACEKVLEKYGLY